MLLFIVIFAPFVGFCIKHIMLGKWQLKHHKPFLRDISLGRYDTMFYYRGSDGYSTAWFGFLTLLLTLIIIVEGYRFSLTILMEDQLVIS
jgi:hypothetical protein